MNQEQTQKWRYAVGQLMEKIEKLQALEKSRKQRFLLHFAWFIIGLVVGLAFGLWGCSG